MRAALDAYPAYAFGFPIETAPAAWKVRHMDAALAALNAMAEDPKVGLPRESDDPEAPFSVLVAFLGLLGDHVAGMDEVDFADPAFPGFLKVSHDFWLKTFRRYARLSVWRLGFVYERELLIVLRQGVRLFAAMDRIHEQLSVQVVPAAELAWFMQDWNNFDADFADAYLNLLLDNPGSKHPELVIQTILWETDALQRFLIALGPRELARQRQNLDRLRRRLPSDLMDDEVAAAFNRLMQAALE